MEKIKREFGSIPSGQIADSAILNPKNEANFAARLSPQVLANTRELLAEARP
jgi:hypothetical protein